MNTKLEALASVIRGSGLVLAYGQHGATLAFRYRLPGELRRAIRSHRRGLARLMLQGDSRLCCSPELHRREWYYVGSGRYACLLCQQLDKAQLGLWKVS